MKRTAPIMTIGVAVTAMIGLAFGASIPRWIAYICLAVVIIWSLIVLAEWRSNELNRITIGWQARVIRNQAELLGRMLTQDIDRPGGPP